MSLAEAAVQLDGDRPSTTLDARARELVREESRADATLGQGLEELWTGQAYHKLEFVRSADFVREYLGLRQGRVRWLRKLGRAVSRIPELRDGLAEERLCASQVVELGRVMSKATAEGERQRWVERASELSVRGLRKEIREAVAAAGGEVAEEDENPDEPQGQWVTVPAPARVIELWHMAVDLVRKSVGYRLSLPQCMESLAADCLSRVGSGGDLPMGAVGGTDARAGGGGGGGVEGGVEEGVEEDSAADGEDGAAAGDEDGVSDEAAGEDGAVAGDEDFASDEAATDEDGAVAGDEDFASDEAADEDGAVAGDEDFASDEAATDDDPQVSPYRLCAADPAVNPFELATYLRQLAEDKKLHRLELGGVLDQLHRRRLWARLGFPSFNAYCDQRLGMSRRRAEKLIRFKRGLDRFPLLNQAYLGGQVSYTAALSLLRVLHQSTELQWVEWGAVVSVRELERAVEYAVTYMLPQSSPEAIAAHARSLEAAMPPAVAGLGNAADPAGNGDDANAFADGDANGSSNANSSGGPTLPAEPPNGVPPGYALPPTAPRGRPRIAGLPPDAIFRHPERIAGRIQVWAPRPIAELFRLALARCRQRLGGHFHDWSYLEVMLVDFIQSHDSPDARRLIHAYPIISRDNFECGLTTCTCRRNLHQHHLWLRGFGGSDDEWNQLALCAGHHLLGFHDRKTLELGGWAPINLFARVGIDPRTHRALLSFHNDRRAAPAWVARCLRQWHRWCRRRFHRLRDRLRHQPVPTETWSPSRENLPRPEPRAARAATRLFEAGKRRQARGHIPKLLGDHVDVDAVDGPQGGDINEEASISTAQNGEQRDVASAD
jgi:hypothetical protein